MSGTSLVCVLCGSRLPSLDLLEQHLTEHHSDNGSLGAILRHRATAAGRWSNNTPTTALFNTGNNTAAFPCAPVAIHMFDTLIIFKYEK